jgi:hypothetical protein
MNNMRNTVTSFEANRKLARRLWGKLSFLGSITLRELSETHGFSIACGDLQIIAGRWYVTHAGLLRLASRKGCVGIAVQPARAWCDATSGRWAFKATVYKTAKSKGFVGYGDADPSNVSSLVHGAEMRVAETRAVNRALRKAYGIGICSVEEVGSSVGQSTSEPDFKKRPLSATGNGNGNVGGRTVRDRLCQLIRRHQLDAALVKSYATEFCGVKILRDATREQVENFVAYLADWAEKDRNALLCQLNSYSRAERGAA